MQNGFIKFASKPATVKKGLMVSLIVGTVLNVINQGDLFIYQKWESLNFFKLFLTYVTPFLVSVYSTATALQNFNKTEKHLS
ncbi:MAG: nitrate/nitrite transporter NrtS [Sporocytophaga sp.]|uniref:nitrate/nitrite transporter NrtS n=1 Tax=Sporocytophaga sp. TaxID=2231183 RepID=UPI001B23B0AE|nr:nitrate/nitrite transporter NrtS [Sporocytophaga sp.]MBO9701278.1 nitrate/nitrite transporter NrtS [Sporocytophaga sp.]